MNAPPTEAPADYGSARDELGTASGGIRRTCTALETDLSTPASRREPSPVSASLVERLVALRHSRTRAPA